MPDTLPPLNALRAFVAAARHESFLLAGKELHVSAGAISRHVKSLELYLKTTLFERQTNGVRLSPEGRAYLEKTEPPLADLAKVTQAFLTRAQEEVLVISTLPIFAEKWLNPRLPEFQKLHPRIHLRLDFHDGIDTEYAPDTDAMIVYTDTPPQDGQAIRLFGETLVPVCSPAFCDRFRAPPSIQDILQQVRLQDTFWSEDWNIWSKAMGQQTAPPPAELSFGLYNGVIQAAKSDMGIAIGHTAMTHQELEKSELFAFEEYATPSPASYYLVTPRKRPENNNLAAFQKWITDQSDREVASAVE